MQVKTMLRYHLTLVRMIVIKPDSKGWRESGRESLFHCWSDSILIQHHRNFEKFPRITIWPSCTTHEHICRRLHMRYFHICIPFCSIHNSKTETTSMPIIGRIDNENMMHIHNGIQSVLKKNEIYKKMYKSGKSNVK